MEIRLTPYEEEIEKNLEKARRVENFEAWKETLKETARRTLAERKKVVILKFSSEKDKEEALRMLKERFGCALEVLSYSSSGTPA